MTSLTNQIEAADDNIVESFFASLPTVADLIEATTVLAIAGLVALSLNMML
ncbi:hypothetical protein [Niveispirillum sp.]|uniref:hypothetical protein n=1 Tax=Niveispirillum sp. TaxID=1917217 RepID=UPI001B56AF2F|nr:hypothetical protein [Niveispirillum sp.]MBP7334636.1 hypothetical protein [Niveispirillum sp.]